MKLFCFVFFLIWELIECCSEKLWYQLATRWTVPNNLLSLSHSLEGWFLVFVIFLRFFGWSENEMKKQWNFKFGIVLEKYKIEWMCEFSLFFFFSPEVWMLLFMLFWVSQLPGRSIRGSSQEEHNSILWDRHWQDSHCHHASPKLFLYAPQAFSIHFRLLGSPSCIGQTSMQLTTLSLYTSFQHLWIWYFHIGICVCICLCLYA